MPFAYRPTLSERLHLNDPAVLKAVVWSFPFSTLVALLVLTFVWKISVPLAIGGALLAFGSGVVCVGGGAAAISQLFAVGGAFLLLPSGRSTPKVEEFSLERALVTHGKLNDALALVRRRLASEHENAALYLFAADLYAQEAANPRRAEALFRRVKGFSALTPRQHMYATNRLIDLYMGVLDNPTRAAEQLREVVERHPMSREAEVAQRLLESLSEDPIR